MRYDELNEGMFGNKIFVHETTPEKADIINKTGFEDNYTGIFFNMNSTGYSGGSYGGAYVKAILDLPRNKVLDFRNNKQGFRSKEMANMAEDWDGHQLAEYCHNNNYLAWIDDLQIAVFNYNYIEII